MYGVCQLCAIFFNFILNLRVFFARRNARAIFKQTDVSILNGMHAIPVYVLDVRVPVRLLRDAVIRARDRMGEGEKNTGKQKRQPLPATLGSAGEGTFSRTLYKRSTILSRVHTA